MQAWRLGLPLLDSMVPAQTPLSKTAAAPVRRFLGIWHPHGAAPGYWSPLQEGKNFDFSFITKPLEPFRNRVTLISGMDMPEAAATTEEPGGDHARGAVLLSRRPPAQKRGESVSGRHGRSVDRAEIWPGHDPRRIQLGVEEDGNFGNCNWGYSCAYTNCISWTSPTQPLPTEVNPRVAFERLFGDGTSPEERRAGRKQNASILDSVTQEIAFFKKAAGRGRQAAGSTRISKTFAKSSAASRSRWTTTVKEPSDEIPFGLPENKTRPLPPDVRPAGAGV